MIDINKKYTTRDGREVRIYATDAGSTCSVHGAIKCEDHWELGSWYADGRWTYSGSSNCDLILVLIKARLWVNVYIGVHGVIYGAIHNSLTEADTSRRKDCIACVQTEEFEVPE